MFSLESPHGGVSNEYTQYILRIPLYTTFKYKKRKLPKIIPNLQLWDFFQGTQERVRNSRGKQAISVRATEGLLWLTRARKCNSEEQQQNYRFE